MFRKFQLRHSYGAFTQLRQNHKVLNDLEKMDGDGYSVYMITKVWTVATGTDGKITMTHSSTTDSEFTIKLPLSEAAKLAGYPVPSGLDPELVTTLRAKYKLGAMVSLQGEQVYSVEYCQVVYEDDEWHLQHRVSTWQTLCKCFARILGWNRRKTLATTRVHNLDEPKYESRPHGKVLPTDIAQQDLNATSAGPIGRPAPRVVTCAFEGEWTSGNQPQPVNAQQDSRQNGPHVPSDERRAVSLVDRLTAQGWMTRRVGKEQYWVPSM